MTLPSKSADPRSSATAASPDLTPSARAEAALARLLEALEHLSSHRDDGTAIVGLELFEALRSSVAAIDAQQFQSFYHRIRERGQLYGDPARSEWKQAHGLAVEALHALAWLWRERVARAPEGRHVVTEPSAAEPHDAIASSR